MAHHPNWPVLPGGPSDEVNGGRRTSFAAISSFARDKPKVDITLDDQQEGSFVPSYTTLDRIHGTATITCHSDTAYESIHVLLQGGTKTFMEKIASTAPTSPRTHAYHNFLRLVQPMDGIALPEDGVLKAGVTYRIPFTFVVPERLLPQACTHSTTTPSVKDAHLVPPPSFGDPMMAGDGKSLLNDLAPPMTMVSYGVRVIVARRDTGGSHKLRTVADAMKKLRITPATEEQPPLTVQDGRDDYQLRRTKVLKKGLFKGKLGSLTVSAQQPSPFRLPFIRASDVNPEATTTLATVDLLFEPESSNTAPPRLDQLLAKLKVTTYFATAPMTDFPAKTRPFTFDPQRGVYIETVPLSSRRIESVQWTLHEGLTRRDSGVSVPAMATTPAHAVQGSRSRVSPSRSPRDLSPTSPGSPASPGAEQINNDDLPPPPEGRHYTARVLVPISLPTAVKAFVPTFHTCLITRTYTLDLALSAHGSKSKAPGLVGSSTTLRLKLPFQITQEGNPDATPYISASEAAHIRNREEAAAATERRASAMHDGADDESSGMADMSLRGARGSIFNPPRWGSVSWGDGSAAAQGLGRRPSAFSESEITEEDDVEHETETEGGRAAMLAALEDEAHEVTRQRTRDDPPMYTAFNGVASRARGANMWT